MRFHIPAAIVEKAVRTVSSAQVRQPVNARGLGRWRPYAARLAPLIAELQTEGRLSQWDDPRVS